MKKSLIPMGGKHTYRYYPGGQLESVTRPGGESEKYEYDRNGNIVRVTDGLGSVTTLEYDCMDRINTIINPLGHSKRFGYDAMGNITSITDENNNRTTYEYSPAGQLISVTDAMGHSTKYGYDAASRLTRMEQYRLLDETYANLKQIELQVTTWERNRRGEVTKVSTPLGEVSQYKYDAMGNLTSKTDEDGLETLYEYTLANKLSKVIYSDGRTVELSYNPLRQLTELRDWLGTTSIDVDALGRAEKVTDFEGKTVKYEWDKLGRRKATIYPDESKVDYSYDTSGRLEQVLSETGSTQYKYDVMGRIRERILPDNIITQYTTDPLGRLESLTHCKNGEVLDQFKYTYDPVGNITEIDKHRNGVEADSGLFKYTYDPLGRLTQSTNNQSSKQYKYDSLGNRVMSLQNGVETRHSYNARNQLIRTEENETVNEYSYDKRGNLTQILENGTIKASYVFDSANRMVEAHTNKGKAEYVYNGFLNRVKKLESLQNTDLTPDPCKEVRYILDMTLPYNNLLMTQSEQNQSFIWGNDLLQATGEDSFYYLNDHLGSPIRLMGNNENDTPLAYDEFGVPLVEVANNNPFGFTGYMMDNISDLYFAQARYYSSVTARFVSEDPISNGFNWYSYCGNNPIFRIDPLGLKEVLLSEIAEEYGGVGYWTDKGEYCVSFGSVGWKTYGKNSIAYKKKDGNMYINDAAFIKQWGIRESKNEYNSELDVYATFTNFKNPNATNFSTILFQPYIHRLTANGNEIDVYYTSELRLPSYGSAFHPSSKYIDIRKITGNELEVYNGGFQTDFVNALGSLPGEFGLVGGLLGFIPMYNAELKSNAIIIEIGKGATSYIIDGNTKELILTSFVGKLLTDISSIYGGNYD